MGTEPLACPVGRALLALCAPAGVETVMPALSPQEWEAVRTKAENHGLVARLYAATARADGADCPAEILSQLQFAHLSQSARNVCALRQLEELGRAFARAGLHGIALKGAAVLLSSPGALSLRRLDDLDLLVEAEAAPKAAEILDDLGYTSTELSRPRRSWAEEQLVERRREHLAPFVRESSFPVEIHINLMRRARRHAVLEDVWDAAVPAGVQAPGIHLLCPEHFFIHTAVHYIKHLEMGFAPLKSLGDLLELASAQPLDVSRLERTASRWGVARELTRVMATLRHYWALPLARCAGAGDPIALPHMLEARSPSADVPDVESMRYHLTRIRRVRELPDLASQAAYLVRLFVPTPTYLRYRYDLADDTFLLPYYGRRLATGVGVAVRSAAAALSRAFDERASAR